MDNDMLPLDFRQILRHLPVGIAVLKGPDFRYLYINDRLARMNGLPAEDHLGKRLADVLPEAAPDILPRLRDTVESRTPSQDREFSAVLPGDPKTTRTLLDSFFPMFDHDGSVTAVCAVVFDITERKHLQEQLLHSQKMELIGNLAGGIAHDFNNLLTIVGGHSERLLCDLPPHDPLHRSATIIREATWRAAALTQQLLAFSRQQVLQPRTLDLNEVVASTHGLLSELVGEQIVLVVESGSDVGHVIADSNQLVQALMNLALNARDAMPNSGTLRLTTSTVDANDRWLREQSGAESGPYVALRVTDTGSGMDATTAAHVFDPFFTTKEAGTGLGLSTVYGIVRQSGGQIRVESEPGRGTTFTIYLPQVDQPVSTLAAEPSRASGDGAHGTETILVVEDEDDVRALIREELEILGYSVLTACDGIEALRVHDTHAKPIHLVLTDMVMPRMNGQALAARLMEQDPTLKVMYISGYASDRRGPLGVEYPERTFLRKPFALDELALRVREILDTV